MDEGPASPNPVILVLLVTLGSLMVGLIPFAYALTFGTHNPRLQRRLPLERQTLERFGENKNVSVSSAYNIPTKAVPATC